MMVKKQVWDYFQLGSKVVILGRVFSLWDVRGLIHLMGWNIEF